MPNIGSTASAVQPVGSVESSSTTVSETSCPSRPSSEQHPIHDGSSPAGDVTKSLPQLPTFPTRATKRFRVLIHGLARSIQPPEAGSDPGNTAETPHGIRSEGIVEYAHAQAQELPVVTRSQHTSPGDVRAVATISSPPSNPVLCSLVSDGDDREPEQWQAAGSPLSVPHSPILPTASMRTTSSPSPRMPPSSVVALSSTGVDLHTPSSEPLQGMHTATLSLAPAASDAHARAQGPYPTVPALPILRPRATQSAAVQCAEDLPSLSRSNLGMIGLDQAHHLPDDLSPVVTVRPFRAGTQAGYTRWYKTSAPYFIVHPPTGGLTLQPGDLFVHEHLIAGQAQIWLWGANREWMKPAAFAPHPTIADRFLSFRTMVEPSWVKWRTVCTYRSKDRSMQVQSAAQVSVSKSRLAGVTHQVF